MQLTEGLYAWCGPLQEFFDEGSPGEVNTEIIIFQYREANGELTLQGNGGQAFLKAWIGSYFVANPDTNKLIQLPSSFHEASDIFITIKEISGRAKFLGRLLIRGPSAKFPEGDQFASVLDAISFYDGYEKGNPYSLIAELTGSCDEIVNLRSKGDMESIVFAKDIKGSLDRMNTACKMASVPFYLVSNNSDMPQY